jgi:hypothetical protein
MAELEINSNQELTDKLNELAKDSSINKPSEEEVNQAKLEFEQASKEWVTIMYPIGTIEDTETICNYVKHFIRNRFAWEKDAWMGVIKLTDELEAAVNLFKTQKDKPVELGYQALEFTYYILTNPGGKGLQDALDFESEQESYTKSVITVGKQLEIARKKLKEIEFLQQKWGAMAQGFYLEIEPAPETNETTNEQTSNETLEKESDESTSKNN